MEAKIIIPIFDNDGSDNAAVIEQAIREMCAKFGGVTVYEAKGFWMNEDARLFEDRVNVLIAAVTETAASDTLNELAKAVLDETDQEAVFVALNGDAKIVKR